MSSSREYELIVRQQPQQARVCSADKLDRRPIDPPPIIQFSGVALPNESSDPQSFLDNPNYFMFASLVSPDEDVTVQYLADGKTRALNGPAVSNLWHLQDPQNESETTGFFVFPELSVRLEGRFRLKLTLFEVQDALVHHCKSIFSDAFRVHTPSKFPGMQVSTELSCALADQGIKIRLRHDTRVRTKPANRVAGPAKRARDPGGQSGARRTKRAKNVSVEEPEISQSAWGVIDPALAGSYAPYPPSHLPAPSLDPHYSPQYNLTYPPPPEPHAYAHYPLPPQEQWDPSLQHMPPPPTWYGHAPQTAPTFESDDKQSGGTKTDATPRRVLRARPGTVSLPHG